MNATESPPAVSIIGRKNSGKTTLLVALAAELKRRGRRIATLKHGHPHFEVDRPGSDTWRHKHEGGAAAVLMASSAKIALIADVDGAGSAGDAGGASAGGAHEPDPRELIAWAFGGRGYDLILVEGYKRGPFPKVEVFRGTEHDRPIHDPREPDAAGLIAVVTDDPDVEATCPVIELGDGAVRAGERSRGRERDSGDADPPPEHVLRLADLLEERFLNVRA